MTKALERTVGITSRIAPGLGAAVAEEIWFRPFGRRGGGPPPDAEPFSLTVGRQDLTGFTVGSGEVALLLHGWGGAGSDMTPIALALARAGYRTVVIDLPGHGANKRTRTDLFMMSAAIGAVSGMFGLPSVVVAHSFGAAAAFTAFPHGGPKTVIFLAPAIRGERFFDYFGERLRLGEKARAAFRRRIERFAGPQVVAIMQGRADIPGARFLILHDPDDPRTPFVDAEAFATGRDDITLVPVPRSGHRGILSDASAIQEVVGFVGAGQPS